LPKPEVAQST
jgi:hypothetical protein